MYNWKCGYIIALLLETSIVVWLDGCDLVITRMSVGMFGTNCLEVTDAVCSVFVGVERATKGAESLESGGASWSKNSRLCRKVYMFIGIWEMSGFSREGLSVKE